MNGRSRLPWMHSSVLVYLYPHPLTPYFFGSQNLIYIFLVTTNHLNIEINFDFSREISKIPCIPYACRSLSISQNKSSTQSILTILSSYVFRLYELFFSDSTPILIRWPFSSSRSSTAHICDHSTGTRY